MAEVASAYVALIPSFKGVQKAIESEVGAGTSKASGSPGVVAAGAKTGKSMGKGITGGIKSSMSGLGGQMIGAMGMASLVTGVAGYVSSGVAAAGNLEQSVGAVEAVFKGSAGEMLNWSKSAATTVGLTQNEYNELATVIGSQLKNGGTAIEEIGGKANDLIGTGADLASMFGGTTADAVGALSSALKGERDPIEAYGVSLNQAKIDAKAAELGFSKVGGTLSAEANQAATLALIMEQTADAHGNFAKEADTVAGKQQRLDAVMGNISTTLGGVFLPALDMLLGVLGPIAGFLAENEWAVALLAGVLGGVLVIALAAATVAAWAFVAPLLANPITWIVVGIVALIAALIWLVANWDMVTAWITDVWGAFVEWLGASWQSIVAWVTGFGAQIGAFLSGLWAGIAATATSWWNSVVSFIGGIPGRIMDGLSFLASLGAAAAAWFMGVLTAATDKFGQVVTFVGGIPGKIMSALGNLGSLLVSSGRSLVDGFLSGIKGAWSGLTGWVSDGMANLRGLWPFSPAKWGPFSGRGYVTHSGAALTGDFAKSIVKGTPQIEAAAIGMLQPLQIPSWSPPRADATVDTTQRTVAASPTINIYNPEREPASRSIQRVFDKAAYLGIDALVPQGV